MDDKLAALIAEARAFTDDKDRQYSEGAQYHLRQRNKVFHALADELESVAAQGPCLTETASSRICERGTHGCPVQHTQHGALCRERDALKAQLESVAKERDEARTGLQFATDINNELVEKAKKWDADRDALLKFLHELTSRWRAFSETVNLINQELRKYEK